jgi:hypothetical protein
VTVGSLLAACAQAPIALKETGSSHVGGRYNVVELPRTGIRGNSHMMMMDKNNNQVAAVIQDWLQKQDLYR